MADRSVHAYTELARRDPQAFEASLAMAFNGLANRQAARGDLVTAVATAERSVALRRQLVKASPAVQPQLAMSLNSLAVRYREAGDLDRSIEAAREAVAIYRQLDAGGADIPRATAMALSNLSVAVADHGQRREARAAAAEVVQAYVGASRWRRRRRADGTARGRARRGAWPGAPADRAALARATRARADPQVERPAAPSEQSRRVRLRAVRRRDGRPERARPRRTGGPSTPTSSVIDAPSAGALCPARRTPGAQPHERPRAAERPHAVASASPGANATNWN